MGMIMVVMIVVMIVAMIIIMRVMFMIVIVIMPLIVTLLIVTLRMTLLLVIMLLIVTLLLMSLLLIVTVIVIFSEGRYRKQQSTCYRADEREFANHLVSLCCVWRCHYAGLKVLSLNRLCELRFQEHPIPSRVESLMERVLIGSRWERRVHQRGYESIVRLEDCRTRGLHPVVNRPTEPPSEFMLRLDGIHLTRPPR